LPSISDQPDRRLATVVLPQNVGFAVAVESPVPMICQLVPGFAPTSGSLNGMAAFIDRVHEFVLHFDRPDKAITAAG
jgi:hypothetical protein